MPRAEVEHVGATAVPGALTKGDVDLLVRVGELPVGIQLVVTGSEADRFFGPFRDALIDSPTLLAEYDELKLRLDGLEYERYTEQKGQFIERVLRELNEEVS